MNTKISKIMSVLATVAIVASSFVWALPVEASNPGDAQFSKQDIPSSTDFVLLNGGSVIDIAPAGDGKTVYAIALGNAAGVLPDWLYKSTDGGQTWDSIKNDYTNVNGANGAQPKKISVASDDVNTIAVVDNLNKVIISKDGGTTWSSLPSVGLVGTQIVTDIAAAPARSGTLLGREYVVSIADTAAGTPVTPAAVAIEANVTATFTMNGTYTVTYVNQAGTSATTTANLTIANGTTAGTIVPITLNGGDTARSVTSVNALIAANTTDTFKIQQVATPSVLMFTVTNGATGAGTAGPGPTPIGATGFGDVKIIGQNAGWTSVVNSIAGLYDFTSVVVSPNFLGDRSVVAVGTGNSAGFRTSVFFLNTATGTLIVNPTPLEGTVTTFAADVGSANGIVTSSIAIPTNFDPTTSAGRRVYVGFNAPGSSAQDAYRVDNDSVKALGAVTNAPVFSVAYAGTIDSGTLFVGRTNDKDVKYSKNPTAASPDWTTTLKGPASADAAPRVTLAVASDFSTSNKVFAGTQGAQSGFAMSKDAGVSFVQTAFVNVGQDTLTSPSVSFVGSNVLVTTKTGAYYQIWKSPMPMTTTSWQRLFAELANGGSTKTSGSAIYVFETGVAGGKIWVSQDDGISFSNRNAPTSLTYRDAALRDTQTAYFLDTAGGISKSTNAAFVWNTVVATGIKTSSGGKINLPKANQVLISGDKVAISNDDAATFTSFVSVPGVSGNPKIKMARDAAYATNNLLYVADTAGTADNTVYRIKTDNTGNTWESLANNISGTLIDLTQSSGVLYVTFSNGIERTLNPSDQVGNTQQNWHLITEGLPANPALASGVSATGSIDLYQQLPNGDILAFRDSLATAKPTLTEPADNYSLSVNPSTGFADVVTFKWQPMGNGTAQVNDVDIEIADKNNGLTGQPSLSPGITTSNPFFQVTSQVFQLLPNHSYLWRVRAAGTTSGQAFDSKWSDARTINVQAGGIVSQQYAGVVLTGPQGGATNLDPNLVGFSWAPVQGATEYQIVVATDAALTKTVAGTPAKVTTTSYQATGLAYGTTYFWAVQATKPTTSTQSIGTFTTMQKPSTGPTPTTGGGGGAVQPTIIVQPAPAETPAYIWAVIAIGAILVIAVIILIVRTRRVP